MKTYILNGELYDLPDDVDTIRRFLAKHPKAEETSPFSVGQDIYDIPVSKQTAFLQSHPDAIPGLDANTHQLKDYDKLSSFNTPDTGESTSSLGGVPRIKKEVAQINNKPLMQSMKQVIGRDPYVNRLSPTYDPLYTPEEQIQRREARSPYEIDYDKIKEDTKAIFEPASGTTVGRWANTFNKALFDTVINAGTTGYRILSGNRYKPETLIFDAISQGLQETSQGEGDAAGFLGNLKEGRIDRAADLAIRSFIQSAPVTAAYIFSPVMGGTLAFSGGFGQQIRNLETSGMSEKSKYFNAMLYGALEAGTEVLGNQISIDRWFKLSKELPEAAFKKQFLDTFKVNVARKFIKEGAISLSGEGGEEFINSIGQDFADYITGKEVDWSQTIPKAMESFALGFASAAPQTAVMGGMASSQQAKLNALQAKLDKFSELNLKDLDSTDPKTQATVNKAYLAIKVKDAVASIQSGEFSTGYRALIETHNAILQEQTQDKDISDMGMYVSYAIDAATKMEQEILNRDVIEEQTEEEPETPEPVETKEETAPEVTEPEPETPETVLDKARKVKDKKSAKAMADELQKQIDELQKLQEDETQDTTQPETAPQTQDMEAEQAKAEPVVAEPATSAETAQVEKPKAKRVGTAKKDIDSKTKHTIMLKEDETNGKTDKTRLSGNIRRDGESTIRADINKNTSGEIGQSDKNQAQEKRIFIEKINKSSPNRYYVAVKETPNSYILSNGKIIPKRNVVEHDYFTWRKKNTAYENRSAGQRKAKKASMRDKTVINIKTLEKYPHLYALYGYTFYKNEYPRFEEIIIKDGIHQYPLINTVERKQEGKHGVDYDMIYERWTEIGSPQARKAAEEADPSYIFNEADNELYKIYNGEPPISDWGYSYQEAKDEYEAERDEYIGELGKPNPYYPSLFKKASVVMGILNNELDNVEDPAEESKILVLMSEFRHAYLTDMQIDPLEYLEPDKPPIETERATEEEAVSDKLDIAFLNEQDSQESQSPAPASETAKATQGENTKYKPLLSALASQGKSIKSTAVSFVKILRKAGLLDKVVYGKDTADITLKDGQKVRINLVDGAIDGKYAGKKEVKSNILTIIDIARTWNPENKTMYHETGHFLFDLMLDKSQKETLLTEFKDEETVMDKWAEYMSGRQTFTGKIKALFEQLKQRFMEFIGQAVSPQYAKETLAVFRQMETGKFGKELSTDQQTTKYKLAPEQESLLAQLIAERDRLLKLGETDKAGKIGKHVQRLLDQFNKEGITEDIAKRFDGTTIKEQTQLASDLMQDMDKARAVIRGEIPAPEGLNTAFLYKAMDLWVIENPDSPIAGEVIMELLESEVNTEISESGSTLSMLRGISDFSPVQAVKKAEAKLKKKAQKMDSTVKKTAKSMKEAYKQEVKEFAKSAKGKRSIENLIRAITCPT